MLIRLCGTLESVHTHISEDDVRILLMMILTIKPTTFGRTVELSQVRGMVSISTGLVQKDCSSMMTLSRVRSSVADYVSGRHRMAVGQRVRKRKERLIGTVAVAIATVVVAAHQRLVLRMLVLVLPNRRLLFAALIAGLALPFETVATVNDDSHRQDDNEQGNSRAHQYAQ